MCFSFLVCFTQTNRFFIILRGRGDVTVSNETQGSLFFRQDNPQMDLFVFFSVFFAAFFMLLAIIVLLWKLKQSVDAQRTRQQQQVQVRLMASRPFAKCLVYIELPPPPPQTDDEKQCLMMNGGDATLNSNDDDVMCASLKRQQQQQHRKSGRQRRLSSTASSLLQHDELSSSSPQAAAYQRLQGAAGSAAGSLRGSSSKNKQRTNSLVSMGSDLFHNMTTLPPRFSASNNDANNFTVNPVCFEQTDDGLAGVGTVLMQMPGGAQAPTALCFGSVLLHTRALYPALVRSHVTRTCSTSV